jgi:hypothetical protein
MNYASTQTTPENVHDDVLTLEKLHKMLELVIPETPLFYVSEMIDPKACYKMAPPQIPFYSIDKTEKLVYICGIDIADALIKKGVAFENYPKPSKPEGEK